MDETDSLIHIVFFEVSCVSVISAICVEYRLHCDKVSTKSIFIFSEKKSAFYR